MRQPLIDWLIDCSILWFFDCLIAWLVMQQRLFSSWCLNTFVFVFLCSVSSTLPTGQLSNVPWRRAGVKYTNNEAYFDVKIIFIFFIVDFFYPPPRFFFDPSGFICWMYCCFLRSSKKLTLLWTNQAVSSVPRSKVRPGTTLKTPKKTSTNPTRFVP